MYIYVCRHNAVTDQASYYQSVKRIFANKFHKNLRGLLNRIPHVEIKSDVGQTSYTKSDFAF